MTPGGSTAFQSLKGKAARAVVLASNGLKNTNRICIFPFSNKELGRLLQPDDGDAQNRENKDKCTRSVPYVAPALVISSGTRRSIVTGVVRKEGPGKQTSN